MLTAIVDGEMYLYLFFFGWVAVAGTYFLIAQSINPIVLLPATTMGLFSTAVLNLNNLRDVKNDKESGKRTLVVKLGFKKGRIYHVGLISGAIVSFISYLLISNETIWAYLPLITLPLFIRNIMQVYKVKDERLLDPELKKLALSITLFTLLFAIGIMV